jgi:hypothetical protein
LIACLRFTVTFIFPSTISSTILSMCLGSCISLGTSHDSVTSRLRKSWMFRYCILEDCFEFHSFLAVISAFYTTTQLTIRWWDGNATIYVNLPRQRRVFCCPSFSERSVYMLEATVML